MDHQLRKTLNDKLDGLRPDDAFTRFDRQDTWAAIERQLEPAPRIRRLRPMWPLAAAAAVVGILIGGFTMRYVGERRQGYTGPTFTHHFNLPAVPTAPRPAHDSGGAVSGAPPAAIPAAARPVVAHRNVVPAQPAPTRQPPTPGPSLPAPVPVAAGAVAGGRQRAVHLLDIDTQSRTALLNERNQRHEKPSVTGLMMVRAIPAPAQSEAPAAVLPLFR